MNIRLINILQFFLIISCGGVSDTIVDLGEGYFYNGEGPGFNHIFYGKKQGNQWNMERKVILPEVVKFNFNNQFIVVEQIPNYDRYIQFLSEDISSKYLHYLLLKEPRKLNNSLFKERQFLQQDSLLVELLLAKGFKGNNEQKDKDILMEVAVTQLKNNNQFFVQFDNTEVYWIIEKASNTIYGPLSFDDFSKKYVSLQIPKSLNLRTD